MHNFYHTWHALKKFGLFLWDLMPRKTLKKELHFEVTFVQSLVSFQSLLERECYFKFSYSGRFSRCFTFAHCCRYNYCISSLKIYLSKHEWTDSNLVIKPLETFPSCQNELHACICHWQPNFLMLIVS